MGDWLDKLLAIGSTPDWITPALGLINDAASVGNRADIYCDAYGGYSVNDVTKTIKRAGLKCWGGLFLDDMIVVSVRKDDATAAKMALMRKGIIIAMILAAGVIAIALVPEGSIITLF